MIDADERIDELVFDAIAASRGKPASLIDVFERIDAADRFVYPHEDMDAAFRRLGQAGRIRRVGSAYVDATRSRDGAAVDGLTEADYQAGLRAYHESFGRSAANLFGNRVFRFLAKRFTDVDRAAIEFALSAIVAPHGGHLDETTLHDGTLRVPIVHLDPGTDRTMVIERARAEVATRRQGPAHVVLAFEDGESVELR